jgi:hypothetical protein
MVRFYQLILKSGFEIESIYPTSLIPKEQRIPLEIKTKESWNFIGDIHIKYQNNFKETKIEKCTKTNSLHIIKCDSPSWNVPCNISISLSLFDGDFIQTKAELIIYDQNKIQFASISPNYISNLIPFLTIKGLHFFNDSIIKIKYSNNKMEQILKSNFIGNDTIVSPPPSLFLIENMAYPIILEVDVSFDNGLSFIHTKLKVQVNVLGKNILINSRLRRDNTFKSSI